MSTGKRLAKRSIIGTRVCARGDDGFYYTGVINGVKTPGNSPTAPPSETRYTVRFDPTPAQEAGLSAKREWKDVELIGSGFRTIHGLALLAGQKVYITYNGREISGTVVSHSTAHDEVVVSVNPPGSEGTVEVRKRLEEVRLRECRKSARLQDQQDTDYSRLADMAGDRRRLSSHNIDVPPSQVSRKRRPSTSQDENKEDLMDECTAALVLMHLSCSPHSPNSWVEPLSPAASLSDACSWRSNTPSPPLSDPNWLSASDEGIVIDDDFDELPKKKKAANRTVYRCTWRGCNVRTTTNTSIKAHVRKAHLGNDDEGMEGDKEMEEFYYEEGDTSPPPTLSHRDMARPPHEDPEYQRSLGLREQVLPFAAPMSIPNSIFNNWPISSSLSPTQKQMKLSVSAPSGKLPGSPSRRMRGDTKKCRKVYGMEHREQWCTQCKWKKACTRFGD